MNKAQLRKNIAEIIKCMNMDNKREQSVAVFNRLVEHPRYKNAKSISLYLSTGDEIDTEPILRRAIEIDRKRCFVPYIRKSKYLGDQYDETRMIMIPIKSMEEFQRMPLNHYGIREHIEPCFEERAQAINGDLDLIIVPGVAFNLDGRRLGHGKGYYDEFLFNWFKRSTGSNTVPYTIGLAFTEQIVDDLPTDNGDDFTIEEVLMAPIS